MEFFEKLLQSDFMPHGHCYFWRPEILWLTVGGDALTAAAYYSIPLMLFYFARTRRDLAHKHVFFLFAAFILLCGTTHVLDIWTAWVPTYRLAGVVKMVTGLVSIATAVVLYKAIPALLAIPSNTQLKQQIKEREKARAELNQTKSALEARMQERTAELFRVNRELEAEIEERKRAQQALLDRNRDLIRINADLDGFVYCASHDLKAPVLNMEGLLTALREEMAVPDGAVEPILERLELSVRKITGTIQELSDVSRIQRRSEGEVLEEIRFDKVLGDVVDSIQNAVEQSGAQIISDFGRQPSVWFIPRHLESILQNLLTNAIKYRSADREPVVKVSSEETEGYVVLTVEDNGIGIDLSKNDNKMFSLFKRLHDHVEGSGVGLYVIKRIIDNYQGKIEVHSEVGKGTSFQVYLRTS